MSSTLKTACCARRCAKFVGVEQEVVHRLRPWLAGGFLCIQQFAQEVGVAQGMGTVVETPIGRPAIVHEYTSASSENAVLLDCGHTALAVHAVPSVRLVGGDVQPMQFARHAQT